MYPLVVQYQVVEVYLYLSCISSYLYNYKRVPGTWLATSGTVWYYYQWYDGHNLPIRENENTDSTYRSSSTGYRSKLLLLVPGIW